MVAYSFKPRFVASILAGTKAQTIRAPRLGASRHAREGDRLQLYRGMRTRACQLILRTVCIGNVEVTLRWRPIVEVILGEDKLTSQECEVLARNDGFADFAAMEHFWAETHAVDIFRGELIRWRPPGLPVEMGADIA